MTKDVLDEIKCYNYRHPNEISYMYDPSNII